jgi:hypothetical protein
MALRDPLLLFAVQKPALCIELPSHPTRAFDVCERRGDISRRELLARGFALGGVAMAGSSGALFGQEARCPDLPEVEETPE